MVSKRTWELIKGRKKKKKRRRINSIYLPLCQMKTGKGGEEKLRGQRHSPLPLF